MGLLFDAFTLTPAKAVEFLRSKKLRISGAWTQVWKEEHSRAFTVANLLKMDLLQEIRNQINNAVAGELTTDSTGAQIRRAIPFAEFKKRLVPMLKSRGWWGIDETVNTETGEITTRKLGSVARLKTIYHTNTQSALNAGRYRAQREAERLVPYGQFVAVMDGVTTERCKSLNGQVWPLSDPVWGTIYPPNHFGCRSRVRTLTKKMVDDDNIDVQSSSGNMVEKQEIVGSGDNTRTVTVNGVKYRDSLGQERTYYPDPGFDYNPGETAYKPDLSKYDPDIAALYNGAAQ